MGVKLIHTTPLWLISNAIRYSRDNHHLSDSKSKYELGEKDYDLIKRVGFKMKHESVLRHSLIVFEFSGSRGMLQEISTHCVGVEPTRKSTRYTLKELKNEESFLDSKGNICFERVNKYCVLTNNSEVNTFIAFALENVRILISKNLSNDVVKYALPEAYKFKGQYSFNLQSLIHFLNLRTNKDVLPEFQILCKNIIDVLPDDYRELVLLNEKIKNNYNRIKNDKKLLDSVKE
jgi:thymidylate synthase (FAD)